MKCRLWRLWGGVVWCCWCGCPRAWTRKSPAPGDGSEEYHRPPLARPTGGVTPPAVGVAGDAPGGPTWGLPAAEKDGEGIEPPAIPPAWLG